MEKINSNFIEKALVYAQKFIGDLNKSVSHFHAVECGIEKLEKAGFKKLYENESWKLNTSGKYYFTRNSSALFAFTIGSKCDASSCFKIIGTHTDSPNLRLAPNAFSKSKHVEKLHLQTYGGGQWQTWFDRDLSVCGKVIFKKDGELKQKIIRVDEPLFNIPHLAIHLTDNRNKPFDWNNESHLKAILSMGLTENSEKGSTEIDKKLGDRLSNRIAKEVGVDKENLVDFDLVLYDTQPASLFGLEKEFIASGRLDNLGSTIIAIDSIIDSPIDVASINVIACFDNEEVGSTSFQGADSIAFYNMLDRIYQTTFDGNKDSFLASLAKSFAISADLAHATHPNYEGKHHETHKIKLHSGVTIKINANMRYSSDCEGSSLIKELGSKYDIPLQEFMVKQDSPCGSTIGTMMSAQTGIKTIDIGVGCFAMHSIRETASSIDFLWYYQLMNSFFSDSRVDYSIKF